jgi:hypothetical protein
VVGFSARQLKPLDLGLCAQSGRGRGSGSTGCQFAYATQVPPCLGPTVSGARRNLLKGYKRTSGQTPTQNERWLFDLFPRHEVFLQGLCYDECQCFIRDKLKHRCRIVDLNWTLVVSVLGELGG